jgi:hypothetical protein
MKQSISRGEFREAFARMGRKENFSYEGLSALYDHLEGVDENYELDVIALCCEYAEDDVENVLRDYNLGSIEELEENTTVVWHDRDNARVLYVQF